MGGLSAYTQYEGEDGVENQRNLGGLLRVVQREKTPCVSLSRPYLCRIVVDSRYT